MWLICSLRLLQVHCNAGHVWWWWLGDTSKMSLPSNEASFWWSQDSSQLHQAGHKPRLTRSVQSTLLPLLWWCLVGQCMQCLKTNWQSCCPSSILFHLSDLGKNIQVSVKARQDALLPWQGALSFSLDKLQGSSYQLQEWLAVHSACSSVLTMWA